MIKKLKNKIAKKARKFRNDWGRSSGYSWCMNCYDSWGWKEYHIISYNDTGGAFPYCEECHETLDVNRKKTLVDRLITRWMQDNFWGEDWDKLRSQLHAAVEDGK